MEGRSRGRVAPEAVRDPPVSRDEQCRLVTHAELLEHVWGGAVVSESAMRSQLHELRQVLGEGVIDTVIRVAAHRGERQMCFVTGDPGIGKTTLVDAFVQGCDPEDALVLRGSSIEQHGTPEAYAPVIEMQVRAKLRRIEKCADHHPNADAGVRSMGHAALDR